MKNKILLMASLTTAAFVAGCEKEQTASQQMDKVQAETKQAANDIKDYTYAQKAEFTAKMQSQLTTLNQDLDKLSTKVEASSDAIKAEAKPKLQALRDKSNQLAKQLEDIKDSSETTWDKVKASTEKAYDDLQDGFQQARQWLSDKIAP